MTDHSALRRYEEALKPCPFCGVRVNVWGGTAHNQPVKIGCDTEGCAGSCATWYSESDLREAWNTRAADALRGVPPSPTTNEFALTEAPLIDAMRDGFRLIEQMAQWCRNLPDATDIKLARAALNGIDLAAHLASTDPDAALGERGVPREPSEQAALRELKQEDT
jgi:hypothetical protein